MEAGDGWIESGRSRRREEERGEDTCIALSQVLAFVETVFVMFCASK